MNCLSAFDKTYGYCGFWFFWEVQITNHCSSSSRCMNGTGRFAGSPCMAAGTGEGNVPVDHPSRICIEIHSCGSINGDSSHYAVFLRELFQDPLHSAHSAKTFFTNCTCYNDIVERCDTFLNQSTCNRQICRYCSRIIANSRTMNFSFVVYYYFLNISE